MKSGLARRGLVGIFVASFVLASRAAQTPAASPFVGRWEITVQSGPDGSPVGFTGKVAQFIVDITRSGDGLAAKFVDVASGVLSPTRIKTIASKDDELTLQVEANDFGSALMTLVFKGKRSGERLEGTTAPEGETEKIPWVGVATTKTSLVASAPATQPASEQSAYAAALMKAPAMRADALKKFLRDFPDASVKEQATFQLATSYVDVPDRQKALHGFITDFPQSSLKDQAAHELAMSEPNVDDRIAALRRFVADYPSSPYHERALYVIATTLPPGAERDAAQEDFVRAYPSGVNAAAIYRTLWNKYFDETPIDEARLAAAIDGFINATPNTYLPKGGATTTSLRAEAMDSIANRLMTRGVMLPKALEVIRQAIATAGPTEAPRTRATFITTLGEVLFKMKQTPQAEQELRRAVDVAGAEGNGEAWLFLGKIAEERHDDAAAAEDYLKAASEGAPLDTTTSLEAVYLRIHGSLATLEDALEKIERARPRPFEAGHFMRSGATTPTPPRVVLAELFTGAECAPCVAADMAFDGLGERYDAQTVAVLVYHLHVPGPDPMTNADTEARAKYYKVEGTPTMLVDGLGPSSGGGSASMAAGLFSTYTRRIESRLEKPAAAQLTNFRAALSGQKIVVSGDAELIAGTAVDGPRLRLALVQDVVRYAGTNGIHLHTFVVRALIGPAGGTPMSRPGLKTHVAETIDVAGVAKTLDTYLEDYEPKVKPAGFRFGNRVDVLDAKRLTIVAFVQDEKTREILQAQLISPPR